MKHYGLIGEHLGHSWSVPIHASFFRRMGLEADYRLYELPRDTFAQEAAALIDHLDGLNVTIPYKREVMPLLTRVDAAAQAVGAVNTITAEGVGYNTDVAGFAAMLRYYHIDASDRPCFVLGTGGASLAIVQALRMLGASAVTRVSRTPGEGAIGYEDLAERFSGILVNTTPAGMVPNPDGCPLTERQLAAVLPRAEAVVDIIYNPPETRLTAAAAALGIPRCTGFYMLVAQAMEAQRLWQGSDLPEGITEAIVKELQCT